MPDIYTYRIAVGERLDEYDFNAISPQQITMVQAGEQITIFTICADQAGLIGLLRRLHGRGATLLSVAREE
jgi:hypothetical protein